MSIGSRINQVRLEHLLSVEDLAAKAGLSPSLLASFESGRDVPALEMFDRLADAMGVPLDHLFYDKMDSNLTPWLTPRVTWQELADGPPTPASAAIGSLFNPRRLVAATQVFLALIIVANRRLLGKIPKSTVLSSKPRARAAAKARENQGTLKRKS